MTRPAPPPTPAPTNRVAAGAASPPEPSTRALPNPAPEGPCHKPLLAASGYEATLRPGPGGLPNPDHEAGATEGGATSVSQPRVFARVFARVFEGGASSVGTATVSEGRPQISRPASPPPRILIVDDHPDILEALRLLLKGAGYAADLALNPRQALELAAASDHLAILIDMNYQRDTTSGAEGLALLEALRTLRPETPVIAMTAWGSIELAVEAMSRGAAGFIPKPWDNQKVLEAIQKQDRKKDEMSLARRVQLRLLPPATGHTPGVDYDCVFRPAGEVGGDLWNVFATETGTAFMLGDISGKGTAAALLMATLQATIRGNQDLATEPARLATRANRLFWNSTAPEHFATLFLGHYTPATGELRYVNCGHPPPVLIHEGVARRLEATSLPLGAFENAQATEVALHLSPGDRLVAFSDGVSEAREQDQWVVDLILHHATSQEIAMATVSDDDVTILDLRLT